MTSSQPEVATAEQGEAPLEPNAAQGEALLTAAAERIEALLTASAGAGPLARERSEELVRTVTDLYGAGLRQLLDLLFAHGVLDEELLAVLAADPLVSGLLLIHGLHPEDAEVRIERALASVRPYLNSHGGDVQLAGITDDGVVTLRLTGSCDGCASSAQTMQLAVEGAVRDAAPEIAGIEVLAASSSKVIPVSQLRARTAEAGAGWRLLPDVAGLTTSRAEPREVGGLAVIVCAVGSELFAFRDGCGGCSASLAGAPLHRRLGAGPATALLRCPSCGLHFDVRAAGRPVEEAGQPLQPLPLLVKDTGVQIAVPVLT